MPIDGNAMSATCRAGVARIGAALLVMLSTSAMSCSPWPIDGASSAPVTPFAPFVDVTALPTLPFDDPTEQPAPTVLLGFVVADPSDPCRPSWGTFFDLAAAGRSLDLDARVTAARARDGDVVVSFGGVVNDELATACVDPDALYQAYRSVIERYDSRIVDFDIEGPALGDFEAHQRRAVAIAALQRDDPDLQVWLTLPIQVSGLPDDAVDLLDLVLASDIELAGVNAMTMNFGTGVGDGPFSQAVIGSLLALRTQLEQAYERAGVTMNDDEVWSRIGATPMVGQNDVEGEVFTLDDARRLATFARIHELGRLSAWSANRDRPCVVVDPEVSSSCSGLEQGTNDFAAVLGGVGDG